GDDTKTLEHGALVCLRCGHPWYVDYGLPRLVKPGSITGLDWILRPIYDFIAPVHDLGVNLALPLLQFPDFGASRDRYIRALELDALIDEKRNGRPIRILEVGVGAGANLWLLRRSMPMLPDVELWGVDLSVRMLLHSWAHLRFL